MKGGEKMKIKLFIILGLTILVLPLVAVNAQLGEAATQMQKISQTTGLTASDLPTVIGNIIKVVLSFLGIVAVVMIIVAGFMWMTAAGSDEKVKSAQKILKNGIIGLVLIVVSYAIATFIISQLTAVTQ